MQKIAQLLVGWVVDAVLGRAYALLMERYKKWEADKERTTRQEAAAEKLKKAESDEDFDSATRDTSGI